MAIGLFEGDLGLPVRNSMCWLVFSYQNESSHHNEVFKETLVSLLKLKCNSVFIPLVVTYVHTLPGD